MSARRRAPRSLTLTAIGYAAVDYHNQQAALAARPADATAACAVCDTIYSVKGLKPLDSDDVYARASEVVSFSRNDPVCKFCAQDFETDFGGDDGDVYHMFDTGHDPND